MDRLKMAGRQAFFFLVAPLLLGVGLAFGLWAFKALTG